MNEVANEIFNYNNTFSQQGEIKTHEPTLSSSCMLVEYSIGVWEGQRKDRKASDEVIVSKQARKGSARVYKDLLPNCHELTAVKQHRNAARKYHREHTLPWSNLGYRIVTNQMWLEYYRVVTEQQNEFYRLVQRFLDVYDIEVAKAQAHYTALGSLFDPSDYPSANELRNKFHFDCVPLPLPETDDFRVDVQNDMKEQLKSDYGSFYQRQMAAAMSDIWERLLTPLQNMSARLDYHEGEKPTGFHSSLVSNVTDMLEVMKCCNVTNDPEMERVRGELVRTLRNVTADTLRENPHTRATVKRNVDEIIKNLPTFDI